MVALGHQLRRRPAGCHRGRLGADGLGMVQPFESRVLFIGALGCVGVFVRDRRLRGFARDQPLQSR